MKNSCLWILLQTTVLPIFIKLLRMSASYNDFIDSNKTANLILFLLHQRFYKFFDIDPSLSSVENLFWKYHASEFSPYFLHTVWPPNSTYYKIMPKF